MPGRKRVIETEWLDTLSPADGRAIQSRNDLFLVNNLMGHVGILVRALLRSWNSGTPVSLLDLGSGDGRLMLAVARRLTPRWPNVSVTLLDRQGQRDDSIEAEFLALSWRTTSVTSDALDFLQNSPAVQFDIVLANLFLHHLGEEKIVTLFNRTAEMSRLFVAVEPRRSWLSQTASQNLWIIGCNAVTRHDAEISVRAGFRDKELSRLWPGNIGKWVTYEDRTGLFSHCFIAQRHD